MFSGVGVFGLMVAASWFSSPMYRATVGAAWATDANRTVAATASSEIVRKLFMVSLLLRAIWARSRIPIAIVRIAGLPNGGIGVRTASGPGTGLRERPHSPPHEACQFPERVTRATHGWIGPVPRPGATHHAEGSSHRRGADPSHRRPWSVRREGRARSRGD